MPTITRERIRLPLELTVKSPVNDKLTADVPRIWRGVDIQIEVALFHVGVLVDITNISSLRLRLRPADNRTGADVLDKTVTSLANISQANWDNNTAQHALFTFTNPEMELNLGGANEKEFWASFTATLATGEKITFGAAKLKVLEDGA